MEKKCAYVLCLGRFIILLGPRPFKEMTTYEEYVADTSSDSADSSPKSLEDIVPKPDTAESDK